MTFVRPAVSMVFLIGVLITGYTLVILPSQYQIDELQHKRQSLTRDISGLKARLDVLTDQGQEAEIPEGFAWQSEVDVDAELALQDAIVDLAGQFGLIFVTFGPTELSKDTSQDVIALELEIEGQLSKVYAFLAAVEAHSPKVAVNKLRIRPSQSYGDELVEDVNVYLQTSLWSFWSN